MDRGSATTPRASVDWTLCDRSKIQTPSQALATADGSTPSTPALMQPEAMSLTPLTCNVVLMKVATSLDHHGGLSEIVRISILTAVL